MQRLSSSQIPIRDAVALEFSLLVSLQKCQMGNGRGLQYGVLAVVYILSQPQLPFRKRCTGLQSVCLGMWLSL